MFYPGTAVSVSGKTGEGKVKWWRGFGTGKKHYIFLWLGHHLNSPPRDERVEQYSWLLHLSFYPRLKELIVPKMPCLINCKFQACFARLTVTQQHFKPSGFLSILCSTTWNGAVRHCLSPLCCDQLCGYFFLHGHLITEQWDSLKHLGAKRTLKKYYELSTFWQ